MNLFVDPYPLRVAQLRFRVLGSFVKLSILGKRTRRIPLRLVYDFGVWRLSTAWLIVPFINQCRTTIFKAIPIGCVAPDGHENDRVISAKAKVHPLLKTAPFAPAHFNVGNNVIRQLQS